MTDNLTGAEALDDVDRVIAEYRSRISALEAENAGLKAQLDKLPLGVDYAIEEAEYLAAQRNALTARLAEAEAALREARRFLDYFAEGRTSFVGPGTPKSCLAQIDAYFASAAQPKEIPMEPDLQSRLTKADTLLQAAEKALTPFAAAIYNDNGDMTISAVYESRDSYVTAYYTRKRLREYFASHPKDTPA